MNGIRWVEEEEDLLYKGYINNYPLDRLLEELKIISGNIRTDRSVICRLLKLVYKKRGKWGQVSSFYGKQFYRKHIEEFLNWRKNYNIKHKKDRKKYYEENRMAFRNNQRKYYENIQRERPYKELGEIIRAGIEEVYGNGRGYLLRFGSDLKELKIIKSTDTIYHWIRGYGRPRSLKEICVLLNINDGALKKLEYLVSN